MEKNILPIKKAVLIFFVFASGYFLSCLLRAITSKDGMTADFYEFKKSFMETISNQIVNSIRGINRVVYDITSKPPSTIELE